MKECKNCKKHIPNRNVYCNNTCQQEYENKIRVDEWLAGKNFIRNGGNQTPQWIRNYLLKETNNKCSVCGWGEMNPYTKTYPLDIDHIDGNANNNLKENLRVLCPNCHSQTKTYKFAGKRKSVRTYRRKKPD